MSTAQRFPRKNGKKGASWKKLGSCLKIMRKAFCEQGGCNGGDRFEQWVVAFLMRQFPGMVILKAAEFAQAIGMSPTHRIYKNRNMDFRGEIEGGVVLVSQPCGPQAYCDLLLIIDGMGFMIETKASRGGKPMWNCHIPIDAPHLYLFAKTQIGAADLTWSMGRNITDTGGRKKVEAGLAAMRTVNHQSGGRRGVSVAGPRYQPERAAVVKCRQVFDDPVSYTTSVNRERREEDALKWIHKASTASPNRLATQLSGWIGSMGMSEP